MLRQEINLYRQFATPHTSADLLTWKRYWLSNAAVLILLTIIYIFSLVDYAYMKHHIKILQAEVAVYQSEFQKLKSTMPQLFFNNDVNQVPKSALTVGVGTVMDAREVSERFISEKTKKSKFVLY